MREGKFRLTLEFDAFAQEGAQERLHKETIMIMLLKHNGQRRKWVDSGIYQVFQRPGHGGYFGMIRGFTHLVLRSASAMRVRWSPLSIILWPLRTSFSIAYIPLIEPLNETLMNVGRRLFSRDRIERNGWGANQSRMGAGLIYPLFHLAAYPTKRENVVLISRPQPSSHTAESSYMDFARRFSFSICTPRNSQRASLQANGAKRW